MVAFVDLGPEPTVNLFLLVPVVMAEGGWTWGELPRFAGVLAREYVYSPAESARVVGTYGLVMGRMIRTYEADRYCIVARGRVTGLVVRRAEWQWNDLARGYVHAGEDIDGWKAAARAYWDATGELIGSQRFKARSGLLTVPECTQQRPASDILPVAAAA